MKYNEEFTKNDERHYHEDEFNRDVEFGLNKKASFEADSGESQESRIKTPKKSLVNQATKIIKVGAISVAAVSMIVTTQVVHEHTIPSNWTTTINATCIEYGKEEKICVDCGKVIDARLIHYGDHNLSDWVVELESNCSHEGKEIQTCQDCGELLNTRNTPLGDHIKGEWEVVLEKTCTQDGEQAKKCTICNEELETEIVPAAHTEVIDKAVKATCYETGLTQGSHCSECNKIIIAQKTVPITHNIVVVKGKSPTCTESGLTDGQKCSLCDAIIKAQQSIAASHKAEVVKGKAATCTESGLTDGQKCSLCGTIIKAQQSIAPSHKPQVVKGYPADCATWTEGLTDGQSCSLCGTVIKAQQSIAPSHSEEVYVPNGWPTTATCEEGVVGMGRCRNCGTETSTYIEISGALGHNYEERLVTDDTGMTNTMYICSRCGEVR